MDIGSHDFYDASALLYRLSSGLQRDTKEVVFVVGSALTASHGTQRGVADVSAVINMIRQVFAKNSDQAKAFEKVIATSDNPYQTAFQFVQGRMGQSAANQIIRRAVLEAYKVAPPDDQNIDDAACRLAEEDIKNWHLSPGVAALGSLICSAGDVFGKSILTSNFDPLIEIAIKRAGGAAWRTSLHSDGSLAQSSAVGCQVVHFHGYWFGTDTLHTGTQIIANRPSLKHSIVDLLSNKTIVVIGYGGWNDAFMRGIEEVASNQIAYLDLIWAFYDRTPVLNPNVAGALRPALDRGRALLYAGVDCNIFLPELLRCWAPPQTIIISDADVKSVDQPKPSLSPPRDYKQAECDRPPTTEVWVGRDKELRSLSPNAAKVVIITGIGGQGKSCLAAKYLRDNQGEIKGLVYWDWRDCREQGDTIRTQIIGILQRFSDEATKAEKFSKFTDEALVEQFIILSSSLPILFVFDNVDHYINLQANIFVGLLHHLLETFCLSNTLSQIIVTCRPQVSYLIPFLTQMHLTGLTYEEAESLFRKKGVKENQLSPSDLSQAHTTTQGHAFWLALIAAQISRNETITLRQMLDDIRRGRGDTPDILSSIWSKLPPREQTVLRLMAELVRPETREMIDSIIPSSINFKNFNKAFLALIKLNLIVVKPERNAPDQYDLHPLVRQFVYRHFLPRERESFIKVVLSQYAVIISRIQGYFGVHLPLYHLERLPQKAELEVNAGMYAEAFKTLADAHEALIGSGHVEEFIRVARILFEAIDWSKHATTVREFDVVLSCYIQGLDGFEQYSTVDDLFSRWEATIIERTVRYLVYCDVKCFSAWFREEYGQAITWGRRGDDLITSSGIDTQIDCSQNLGLALRDSGDPQTALQLFLKGNELERITDASEVTLDLRGAVYGNIGRCLQFLGRVDEALICYRKSAKVLEDTTSADRLKNRAYARLWIGEVLESKGDTNLAFQFYLEAEKLFAKVTPRLARSTTARRSTLALPYSQAMLENAHNVVQRWIG